MTSGASIDGVLIQWGERLFYPSNRIVRSPPTPRLDALAQRRAAVIRARIIATVTRRAPQVMVKVTGGGRGMGAIAAHFRYITKNGKLDIEDERGVASNGKEALHDLVDRWRYGGSRIEEVSHRREAFNIMLSMPQGTPPAIVKQAAREFAQDELRDHSYVMVLHSHQTNPHVHLTVRAESRLGVRLSPRKADLHRWREKFAEKLRGLGIEAEATRQPSRGVARQPEPLWRLKAKDDGRLRHDKPPDQFGDKHRTSRRDAREAWARIAKALIESDRAVDQELGKDIARFINVAPLERQWRDSQRREPQRSIDVPAPQRTLDRDIDIQR